MRSFHIITFVFLLISSSAYSQCVPCDVDVTSYTVDLSATTDSVWSASGTRNGHCCGAVGSTRCVKFEITVHPGTDEISFNVTSPAPPGGAFYQVNCGDTYSLGTSLCVTGMETFCITYCKSGGDSPTYTIAASRSFGASPDAAVNLGCTTDISVSGLDLGTITWNSIFPGAPGDYNSYLSCLSACDTTIVTPAPGFPAYVDFEVTGTTIGCDAGVSRDTVRVYFNPGVELEITPDPVHVCFGESDATITAEATGGAPPYSYAWNTGETSASIIVGAGTYWVEVSDTTTGCDPRIDTVVVTAAAGPITADAGPDQIVCSDAPDVVLAGIVTEALGGVWTGGAGVYVANDSTLTATYTPTGGEIIAGTVTLTLTTYGNAGCPGATDEMTITIQEAPVVDAGADALICEGETLTLAGAVAGGVGTGIWTTSGTGSFSDDTDLGAIYTPSADDIAAGTVTLSLASTDGCSLDSDDLILTITQEITVDAGADMLLCEDEDASLAGIISGGTLTGIWTTSGTGTFADDTDLTGVYSPSGADFIAGTITLTLTSTVNGGCSAVADELVLTFQAVPIVDAGSDIAICDGETADLLGSVTGGAGTGIWSTAGDGIFSDEADLTATYTPGAGDILAGTITLTLTTTDACALVSDALTLTITPEITVDAGADMLLCEDEDASLAGIISGGTLTGIWTTSGTGTFADDTDLTGVYSPSAADHIDGTVTLTLTSTDNGGCSAVTDELVLTFQAVPIVDAGTDIAICDGEIADLLGSVTGGAGTGIWSTAGDGIFSDEADLTATYTPGAGDILAGTITLTLTTTDACALDSDVLTLTITPEIIVDAGADMLLCEDEDASLAGIISGGTLTGIWTSSGTGTFADDTDLSGVYTPSGADFIAGTVTLTLTSTDNGGCSAVTDDLVLTFQAFPIVDAGLDLGLCEGELADLLGTITGGAETGIWSTDGSGTFSDNTDLNATYTPAGADILAGTIILTLTTTDACATVTDDLVISFTPEITVDAGDDVFICGVDFATLDGAVSGGTSTGIWTTLGSGTFDLDTDLGTNYNLSPGDIAAEIITIVLTSTDNGNCDPVTDTVTINLTDSPFVDAGEDISICKNNIVDLAGIVSGFTDTGIWTTSGSGEFDPSETLLITTYIPSSADTTAGTVTLTLTSTNNETCTAESDDLIITFTEIPSVYAGEDFTICADDLVVGLEGIVTGGASTGIWNTEGSGTFDPADTLLTTDYLVSIDDSTAGSVMLILTSTYNGTCLSVSDTLVIDIIAAPLADAGPDQTICYGDSVDLTGLITYGAGTGIWTTMGSGIFTPSDTILSTTYVPSLADEALDEVGIILTSTNNGSCSAASDTLWINFTDEPFVDAGLDITICSTDTAFLAGIVSGSSTTGIWTTEGDGVFNPSDTLLTAYYLPGPDDIAAGTVTLQLDATYSCFNFDEVVITITPGPTADAGEDLIICYSETEIDLDGIIGGIASLGIWTTTGSGTFTPSDTDLDATYLITSEDSLAGAFALILTSTDNDVCSAASDTLFVTMTTVPEVDAGVDTSFCANNMGLLSGSIIGGAETGIWTSSGTGTFSPTDTDLEAVYLPSPADTSAGMVIITLTATGSCEAIFDEVILTITPGPIVNAGVDTSICYTDVIELYGTIGGASSSGQWTTSGDGTFTPTDTDLDAVYTPGADDIANGMVEIYLNATEIGDCLPEEDTLVLILDFPPIVDGGGDQTVCMGSDVDLSGSISDGVDGSWSTLGSGIFIGTGLIVTYEPSDADTTGGSILLVLTSEETACGSFTDTIALFFVDMPFADAGPDQTVCANNDSTLLSGTTISGEGAWSTSGDGLFTPDDSLITTIYVPGPDDHSAGTVMLYLSTINLHGCPVATDSLELIISPAPVVDAGSDLVICLNDLTVNLDGSVSGGSSEGEWTTTGTGTFLTDVTLLDASYLPSDSDTAIGSIQFILTSTFNGDCLPESDTMTVTFQDLPFVDAGPDLVSCQSDSLLIEGVFLGGTIEWTTSGTGEFVDSSSNPVHYIPSLDDTLVPIEIYITGSNACGSVSDTLIASILPSPYLNVTYSIDCENLAVSFNANLTGGVLDTINWDFGDGISTDFINPTHTYADFGTYAVIVDVVTEDGCRDLSTINVTIDTLPIASFTVSDSIVDIDEIIEFTNTSQFGSTYSWNFGDLAGPFNPFDTLYSYPLSGEYLVVLTVANSIGCLDSTSQLIEVLDNDDIFPPNLPTAFTPNGDGVNDVFYVRGGPFTTFNLRIYNEWGNQIFLSNDPALGWDGTVKGKAQPAGTYIYLFEGTTTDGESYSISSDFSLIR